jgi:hypothetical protein
MDPFTTTLVAIVGLLANFVNEQRAEDTKDFEKFSIWLQNKHHEEVLLNINANQQLQNSLKLLLAQSHTSLLSILSDIDLNLASLVSKLQGFDNIVESVYPGLSLSDQAISILKQLDKSGSKGFFEVGVKGATTFVFSDKPGHIDFKETRFIDDDLKLLVSTGLLIHSFNSSGNNVYTITRGAVTLLKSIA